MIGTLTDEDLLRALQRARELVEQERGVDWDSLDTGDWIVNARLYKREAAPLIPKLIAGVERLTKEVEHLRKEQRYSSEDIQSMRTRIGEAREKLVDGGRWGHEKLVDAASRVVTERDALRSQLASAQQLLSLLGNQLAAQQPVIAAASNWAQDGSMRSGTRPLWDAVVAYRAWIAANPHVDYAGMVTVGGEEKCSVYDAAGACCAGDPQCGGEAERAIEERTAEKIAAWCHDYADASGYSGEDIAKWIRSGAWRTSK